MNLEIQVTRSIDRILFHERPHSPTNPEYGCCPCLNDRANEAEFLEPGQIQPKETIPGIYRTSFCSKMANIQLQKRFAKISTLTFDILLGTVSILESLLLVRITIG